MFFHSQTQLRLEVLDPLPTPQGFAETLFGSTVDLWNGTVTCCFLVLRWSFPCACVSFRSGMLFPFIQLPSGSNSQVLTFPCSEWNASWPCVPFKDRVFTWISAHKQFPLTSISWGWRGWIEFPWFFFFACSQPLAAFHPRSSSRCCAASSRRSTRSSGASWGSHCWVRAGMLGERARSSWVTVLQASGFSWHSHTECSWRSCAPLDEEQIPLDQECSELLELGSPGSEFEAVQCKRGAQNVT